MVAPSSNFVARMLGGPIGRPAYGRLDASPRARSGPTLPPVDAAELEPQPRVLRGFTPWNWTQSIVTNQDPSTPQRGSVSSTSPPRSPVRRSLTWARGTGSSPSRRSGEGQARARHRLVQLARGGWGSKEGPSLREGAQLGVEDLEVDVLDLDPGAIGRFDLVLFLGVLYYVPPARSSGWRVTGEQLILPETHIERLPFGVPPFAYADAELNQDPSELVRPQPDHPSSRCCETSAFARWVRLSNVGGLHTRSNGLPDSELPSRRRSAQSQAGLPVTQARRCHAHALASASARSTSLRRRRRRAASRTSALRLPAERKRVRHSGRSVADEQAA